MRKVYLLSLSVSLSLSLSLSVMAAYLSYNESPETWIHLRQQLAGTITQINDADAQVCWTRTHSLPSSLSASCLTFDLLGNSMYALELLVSRPKVERKTQKEKNPEIQCQDKNDSIISPACHTGVLAPCK